VPQPDPEPTEPTTEPTDEPTTEPVEEPVPSETELARIATPGRVRRAPKFGAFLVAGGLVGAVVGFLVSLLSPVSEAEKPDGSGFLPFLDGVNGARTWLVASGIVLGVLVGGLVAVLADRRSVRGR
jgi:hypothetical protein